jgi:hypothetical protein
MIVRASAKMRMSPESVAMFEHDVVGFRSDAIPANTPATVGSYWEDMGPGDEIQSIEVPRANEPIVLHYADGHQQRMLPEEFDGFKDRVRHEVFSPGDRSPVMLELWSALNALPPHGLRGKGVGY